MNPSPYAQGSACRPCRGVLLLVGLGLVPAAWAAPPDLESGTKPSLAGTEFFEKRVRPLLVERCQECHGSEKQKGGLRLDSRAGLLAGGDTGPAAAPGRPDDSLLVHAV